MHGAMPPQPAVFVHVKSVQPDALESFPFDPPSPEETVHAPPCEASAVALHVNVAPLMHA
jgi:hypothetical protein